MRWPRGNGEGDEYPAEAGQEAPSDIRVVALRMSKSDFRRFVPEVGKAFHFGLTHKQFHDLVLPARGENERKGVEELLSTPFKGVTTNGNIVPGLFTIRPESAPTGEILRAVQALITRLGPEQIKKVCLPLNSRERQLWQNSIVRYEDSGLRLDEVPIDLKQAAMDIIKASLSAAGYSKMRNLMKLNVFLGELVGAPLLLGEWCYQLHIFGVPSATEPWGWQLSGHHLIITCFILGRQMTLTPTFMGAEPNYIDEGPNAGLVAFKDEECLGVAIRPQLDRGAKVQGYLLRHPCGKPASAGPAPGQ